MQTNWIDGVVFRALVVLALLIIPASASAEPDHSLEPGAWALEFQVRPTFLRGGDSGVGISVKRHTSDRGALRLGFFAFTETDDGSQSVSEERFFLPDSLVANELQGDLSRKYRNFSLFAHFVRYVGVGDRIAAFFEAGPVVQRTVSTRSETRYYDTEAALTYTEDAREWRYGGEAQAAFEWFFRTRFSVGIRYGVWAVRTERTQARIDMIRLDTGEWQRRSIENDSEGFSIGTTSATLSVMAYW